MDKREVMPAIRRLLEDAKGLGAAAAELTWFEGEQLEVLLGATGEDRREKVKSHGFFGRVWREGGGSAPLRVETHGVAAVRSALADALQRAAQAPADPLGGPTDNYGINARGMGLEDPRHPRITEEDRSEAFQANTEGFPSTVELVGLRYTEAHESRAYLSSRGVEGSYDATHYSLFVRARRRDRSFELEHGAAARHFANVASLPYGPELARRLASLEGDAPLPAGAPALVLESALLAWIIDQLAPAFDGRRTDTFVHAAADGHLASPKIHLIDDRGQQGGLRSVPFDDRGVAPMPVPIIREGRIGGYYYGPEEGRRAGLRPTGHDVAGQLVPGNLILRPGNRSRTQMLGEVPLALAPDHLEGGLDLRTGRLQAEGPAWILEKGQRRGLVRRIRIDVHISELLGRVHEIAADQERHLHVDCATAVIKGVPITAG